MHKLMNTCKIAAIFGIIALTGASFLATPADADIFVGCWEPGGDACTVTSSCGVGCTITQNYQNWIIIFEV